MHIRPFQAIVPNLDFITSADSFFETVKEEYPEYFANGFFQKVSQEAIYLYRIVMPQRSYTGLIACADIRDYLDGSIKKHEHTLAAREQKQMQLMMRRKAAIKPVLLAYPKVDEINEWIEVHTGVHKPFMAIHFEEDQQQHLLWDVKDGPAIRLIQQLFEAKVPDTYIADGHHRCSTTALLYERMQDQASREQYDKLLCAFYPSDELEIHDYNRIVEGLSELSLTHFMARLSQLFDIEVLKRAEKPRRKHEITLFVNREWYRLRWRNRVLEKYRSEGVILDSMLLDEEVLQNIMAIEDVRSDTRIQYVEGPKGIRAVSKNVVKNKNCVGFCLFPVHLEELMALADTGQALPPKSTWFEPRMRNGIVVQGY